MQQKKIEGFSLYEITDDGRVWSHISKKYKTPKKSRAVDYYYKIVLVGDDGKSKAFAIHQLVAKAFIPNPDNLPEVDHKNMIKTDNRVENLEWVVHGENVRRFWESDASKVAREKVGMFHNGKHLSDETKEKIRQANIGKKVSDKTKDKISKSITREERSTNAKIAYQKRIARIKKENEL